MKTVNSLVADTIPFSWVDGPGNRFVFFFQGCNFDCVMCHNPHTIPLASVHARTYDVDAALTAIRGAMPFISGVTTSGGEATLQHTFIAECFAAIRRSPDLAHLNLMVDSNGYADRAVWDVLIPVMDGAMIDLKTLDPQRHLQFTGKPVEPVLASIEQLAAAQRLYEVRLLLAPGHNDSDADLRAIARYLTGVDPDVRVRINRFNTHGVRQPAAEWTNATEADGERYREVLADAGVRRFG